MDIKVGGYVKVTDWSFSVSVNVDGKILDPFRDKSELLDRKMQVIAIHMDLPSVGNEPHFSRNDVIVKDYKTGCVYFVRSERCEEWSELKQATFRSMINWWMEHWWTVHWNSKLTFDTWQEMHNFLYTRDVRYRGIYKEAVC